MPRIPSPHVLPWPPGPCPSVSSQPPSPPSPTPASTIKAVHGPPTAQRRASPVTLTYAPGQSSDSQSAVVLESLSDPRFGSLSSSSNAHPHPSTRLRAWPPRSPTAGEISLGTPRPIHPRPPISPWRKTLPLTASTCNPFGRPVLVLARTTTMLPSILNRTSSSDSHLLIRPTLASSLNPISSSLASSSPIAFRNTTWTPSLSLPWLCIESHSSS
ncbi:uncharacterized protein STEHIDRAFT_162207 [Stereum hirsutum FP-91666 SS1]|uniref:uncharacterized protein n=1 Tax=Stereum hirsutum (strain FP-91666) TaxID=721885 RepID=UPI0004449722|nr:uncharacterized protein STEHIDRAFT_162207 [Stereum hirsutum FP-91666 SS1]EIM81223.1 hypothetical protein STEHIDRAFT_162207 [Stereum hirsutum FP-91666 SS1]